MRRIGTIGLTLGLGAMAVACLLLAAKPAGWTETPPRVWNLFGWLGLTLPIPEHPGLLIPTLAFLNVPLWQVAMAMAVLLVAASVLFGRSASAAER